VAEITDFTMDFFSLKSKNAVITGGNSGLGQAFTLALAKGGANVLSPSVMDDDGETKKLVEAEGVSYEFMLADITKEGMCKEIVDRCISLYGSIDILINCAGTCIIKDVMDFTRKDWDSMLDLNLNAAFELSHEAAKHMIPQNSGKIINICSLFSFLGGLGSPAYAAMKAGLMGFTKAYADELGKYNIQVNGIAPGYFATKITGLTRSDPEKYKRIQDHIPADRWGDRMDLMGAAVFLSSHASDYINGTVLVVDGGYLVR